MSENSDLRERARKFLASDYNPRGYFTEPREIISLLLAALDAAEREERERCARIAEEYPVPFDKYDTGRVGGFDTACDYIAAAIRREGGKG